MRKFVFLSVITMIVSIAYFMPAKADEVPPASEVTVPATESVKYFAKPIDSRFQYSLPERKHFSSSSKKSSAENDTDEITIDTSNKPVKKVIKVMTSEPAESNPNVDRSSLPMNYDSFPKFYDENDMSTQQFMPMVPLQ